MPVSTVVKTKHFSSTLQKPLATPDGTSLEEQVNTFLATLSKTDILDVLFDFASTGKYGASTLYIAQVVYNG